MNIYLFGLGHIGLPLACWIAMSKRQVYGIDINLNTINSIKNGTISMEEYYNKTHISKLAKNLIDTNYLHISADFKRIANTSSIFIVSVGIADREDGTKDISPIISVIEKIKPFLVPNDLIILRSTLIPGTCENIILPLIEQTKKQINFAYCPETIIETRAFEEFEKNEYIIGAIDDDSFNVTKNFFFSISNCIVNRSPDIKTAEMAKIVQNIHRDVNIAFANEIADVASALDVDFSQLRKLVNTNPRVNMLTAGPGVGGYCLPNALGYLTPALSENSSCPLTLSNTARSLNKNRPVQVFDLIYKALNDCNKTISGSTIAISGLAMKDYCADCRFSPAIDLINLLIERGANVKAYDPLVPLSYPFQVSTFNECIENADCLVIEAKQHGLTYQPEKLSLFMNYPVIIVDTRNVVNDFSNAKLYKL